MFGEVLVFLVLALAVGLPRITRLGGPPRELAFEKVPDGALSDVQAAFLRRLDEQLEGLHYRPVFNIRVANLGSNLSRFYSNATDPALILTSLLRAQGQGNPARNADYVEIITRYKDGTELGTSNTDVDSAFPRAPWKIAQRFPGLDALRLKERHDRAAQALAKELRWIPEREILDQWQESHRRWCEHQVGAGQLRLDAAAGLYRPTPRTALRAIANFLNPFAGPVPLPRALAAAVLGALLPTLGLAALASPAFSTLAIPAPLATAALFAVCGAAAGIAFPERHYAWGLLLSLAPATLLAPVAQVLAVGWVLTVAHWGARWQNARRRLL